MSAIGRVELCVFMPCASSRGSGKRHHDSVGDDQEGATADTAAGSTAADAASAAAAAWGSGKGTCLVVLGSNRVECAHWLREIAKVGGVGEVKLFRAVIAEHPRKHRVPNRPCVFDMRGRVSEL